MSLSEVISLLEKEDYIKEVSNNKKRTRGNLLSFYSSNIRTDSSLITAFNNVVKAIENPNEDWKQRSEQDKFKQYKKLFTGENLALFQIDESNVWTTTKLGEEFKGMLDNGHSKEFVSKILESTLDVNEIEYLSNRLNGFFSDEQLAYAIKKLEKKPKYITFDEDFKVLLTKLTLIKTDEFTKDITREEVLGLHSVLEELGVFKKYGSGNSVQYNTLAASLNTIMDYKNGLVDPAEVETPKRKTTVATVRITRDANEVAKVLTRSSGICEVCGNSKMQFKKSDGTLYSEVHHIVPLGTLDTDDEIDFYDKSKYMINLCPFHHREFHHSADRSIFKKIIDAAKTWGLTEDIIDNK